MKIITNNVPRPILDSYELTPAERAEFDYMDWGALDDGSDSASFFRYKGQVYDLGEFMHESAPEGWSGFRADSFFSGLVVRIVLNNTDQVIVGLALS